MTESQKKATSSVNSKEKSSPLDIDIGDDFLGSWKSMSMAGDGMDFDFGPTTKGKKKDFKFDKMDMDFSLDADFDKLSSFKTDMPGFDISSPIKKSGNSKEKSKEVSFGGEPRAKRDNFAFSFDFDEFADLDFGSGKKKTDEKCDKSKDKKVYSFASGSGGSGDFLTKNVDALEDDDISSKHTTSQGVPISKADTQMDNMKFVTDESSNAEEQETLRTLSSEKIISSTLVEQTQESHSSEERSSPESHSLADNVSDPREEESETVVRKISPGTGAEENGNVRSVAERVHTRILPLENSSAHLNSQSQKSEMSKAKDDNVLIGHINGDNSSKDDSPPESSMTPVIEITHQETVGKRNEDSLLKLHMGSLNGGTTTDELASEKVRVDIPMRSKYFKRQNESESEKQQALVSSTKLISVGNKRMNILPNNPALGKREFGSKSVESGSKFSGISRPLPNVLSRDTPVQTKSSETGHSDVHDNTRECLNADNIKPRNEPMPIIVAHDSGPTKEVPAPRGRDQNTLRISPLRSDVHPSTPIEQSIKDLSQNSLNPGVQATSMKPTSKAELKASEVSILRVSRSTEPKLKALSSMLPKGSLSMRNKEQGLELQGKMAFKRNPCVDTKKQPPPTPTLKRKTFEESTEKPRLAPLKRLSASPCSNDIRTSSEKAVDQQIQIRNHANMADKKSPTIDSSLTEIGIYSSSENDTIFEMAEAYSKELYDMCNMLKKKHEEAKDIIVRAIVNNNNLLMLNHPIHQDKINMVQKFAALLMS